MISDDERLYLKQIIVRLWYFGDFNDVIRRMCQLVGWKDISANNPHLSDSQLDEITLLVQNIWEEKLACKPKDKLDEEIG